MSRIPDYTNVSVALSEVLAGLGLNDVILNKRRRTFLVMETMDTVVLNMMGVNFRVYMFGSQSEGTTIPGLNSDRDVVVCLCDINVIQECRDWKHGVFNVLMVEAEATPPGYCLLQKLKPDVPFAETEVINEHLFRDTQGRVLLKNTVGMNARHEYQEQHGPAFSRQGRHGAAPTDTVPAYTCTSQLSVVQHWLSQLQGPWPSEDMKRCIASSPCFVVPVGSKGSANEELEWRISTSLAERCLMFSLNATQLQVYVLMKMLLKTSINYNVSEESHISSFMCKTVVLHCVQNTDPDAWQSQTLIQYLLLSLYTLSLCVAKENCPHFIMRSNNLMAGRVTQQAKYQLLQNLRLLFDDIISRGLFSLHIDDVANRLMRKLNPDLSGLGCRVNDEECQSICYFLGLNLAKNTHFDVLRVLKQLTENRQSGPITLTVQYVRRLEHIYKDGNEIERSACRLLRPHFYTTLGSLLASERIQNYRSIFSQALAFFSRGLNADVASSRLKLASVFFCANDTDRAKLILRDLEEKYDVNVCEPACGCIEIEREQILNRVEAWSLTRDECDIPKITSACVIFTQAEKNCIPQELHYEMYRSTREDLQYRDTWDYWMEWAVVDSLPYLHFLCYKVYGRLQRRADQQRALCNLKMAIQTEHNLGHRETALNLLGQCMEQENEWNYALQCYNSSLNIRPRNNAAKLLSSILLFRYWQSHG